MIPNARNQHLNKQDEKAAKKITDTLDCLSLSMDHVAFFVSSLPAEKQIRLIDFLMAYQSMAKDSEHDAIKTWANSFE